MSDSDRNVARFLDSCEHGNCRMRCHECHPPKEATNPALAAKCPQCGSEPGDPCVIGEHGPHDPVERPTPHARRAKEKTMTNCNECGYPTGTGEGVTCNTRPGWRSDACRARARDSYTNAVQRDDLRDKLTKAQEHRDRLAATLIDVQRDRISAEAERDAMRAVVDAAVYWQEMRDVDYSGAEVRLSEAAFKYRGFTDAG